MLSFINSILWIVVMCAIFTSGIYFTFKLKFIQFRIRDIINSFKNKSDDRNGISSLSTFFMSVGAKLGVGSLAGVALAIYVGGVGTIFWMWLSALIASVNAFNESVLAVVFRKKQNNEYIGGPSYYIRSGLGMKKLSLMYAVLIILSYIVGFLSIQSNTITHSMHGFFGLNKYITATMICIISFIVIFKGLKVIAKINSILIPLVGLIYITTCLFIIIVNIDKLPNIILKIITESLNIKSMGVGVLATIIIGIQRGIFSNEAGIGTSAISSATTNEDNPVKQGFIQTLGVYVTTLLVGTLTAFVILSSPYETLDLAHINGIEITNFAFYYHLKDLGKIVILITILLFSFTTIVSGYYYGESNLAYILNGKKRVYENILKIITITLLFIGGIISSSFIWSIVDIFVALLALINIYALYQLRKVIFDEVTLYLHKLK